MSQQYQDSEVLKIRKMAPDVSEEKIREFVACSTSNDYLKTGIPLGVIGGLLSYHTLPSTLGSKRATLAYITGGALFYVARIYQTKNCFRKIFGARNYVEYRDRMQKNTAAGFGLKIDQQEPEIYSAESADSFIQESPLSNYDLPFENTSKEFSDTSDYFKEEEPSKKQKVEEKRVTYDDLWMQHRQKQMENQYRDLVGYSANKSKEAETAARRPMEEPTNSDAEYENRNIWN